MLVCASVRNDGQDEANVQNTQQENSNQCNLLSSGQLELIQHRHRVHHDQNIREDMNRRIGEPKRFLVQTIPFDTIIPEPSHGNTIQPSAHDRPGAVES